MMAGDQARVTVVVAVPPELAFEIFTRDIDLWWRRGPKYRHVTGDRALIAMEPWLQGRVFESAAGEGPAHEIGRVLDWQPPRRLVFEWRNANFAQLERTEVEVLFESDAHGTRVSVTHRGWAAIRPDHPARHGQAARAFIAELGAWWGGQMRVFRLVSAQRRQP
jgi:uncharacterized protein YndB with AHSA1/START domain